VVHALVAGDVATVWLLTNDQPPFEPHEVNGEGENGCWHFESGFAGFSTTTPDRVLDRARGLGW
jgi:hypothetical protein